MLENLPIATGMMSHFSLADVQNMLQNLINMDKHTWMMVGYATYIYTILDAPNKSRRR